MLGVEQQHLIADSIRDIGKMRQQRGTMTFLYIRDRFFTGPNAVDEILDMFVVGLPPVCRDDRLNIVFGKDLPASSLTLPFAFSPTISK